MSYFIKICVTLSFLFMISLNVLANTLPINEVTTGQVSDAYLDLFAPSGYTFSIWGLIYILLALYVVSCWVDTPFEKNPKIAISFSISSLLNGTWILLWHYDFIFLSVIVMIGILLCLIYIAHQIPLTHHMYRLIFHVYFAWITIASIANVTTLLVKWDFNALWNEQIWTVFILIVGLVIAVITSIRFKSNIFRYVIIWSYFGILNKHQTFFSSEYQTVIVTVYLSLFLLFSLFIYDISRKILKTKFKT